VIREAIGKDTRDCARGGAQAIRRGSVRVRARRGGDWRARRACSRQRHEEAERAPVSLGRPTAPETRGTEPDSGQRKREKERALAAFVRSLEVDVKKPQICL